MSFDLLKSYVTKQQFPTLDKAITAKQTKQSVVISPRIAYVPEIRSLFVDNLLIGSVSHETKKIHVKSLFVPEFTDLAKDTVFEVVAHG